MISKISPVRVAIPEGAQCIALFGGVYSNHLALAAAIEDARTHRADAMFCLGDLGAFGPNPDKVFPLLWDNQVVTLRGNYDDSLARALDDCQCGYTDPRDNYFARLSYQYTFANTSESNKRWLGSLPDSIRLRIAEREVLLCHGSPRRMNEFLWESTTPDHFLETLFRGFQADVIACTHTGIKWRRELASGRLFVNVGVLGRPENDGTPRVWYALLKTLRGREGRTHRNGIGLEVEFRAVDYDHAALAAEMRQEGLPEEFVATIEGGWWTTCLEILPAQERLRGKL